MKKRTHAQLAALVFCVLVWCAIPQRQDRALRAEATLDTTASATAGGMTTTLRIAAESRSDKPDFLIGAAVAYPPLMASPIYRDTLAREYNLVVPENVMKWETIEPEEAKFDFDPGDALVSFAEEHQMKVRGHTLVWHQQLPGWLTTGTHTRDQLLAILKTHIQTVVAHYKGHVFAWDVVNEAIGDNGSMRETIWYKGIGPDYIEQAFRFAHEADPDVQLFYNDFGAEGLGAKSSAVYSLVKDLKDKGVPIDGVGLQMHVGIAVNQVPVIENVKDNIERLGALGLKVHITEMDVKIQNGIGTYDEKLAAQANVYADVLRLCLHEPACTALLTWGFTDRYSWIPDFTHHPDEPLPFTVDYQPKPAYAALIQTLTEP